MEDISIHDFRATLRIMVDTTQEPAEEIYSYWNNENVSLHQCDREEVLHITRKLDGSFYLEIGNIVYQGDLPTLEEKLFAWAGGEGFFD